MSLLEITSQPAGNRAFLVGGRRLARNTAINLVGRMVPLLVAVVTMPYVIGHLGPDRFGLLSLAWMVVGYFALFNLGVGPATTKFVADLLGKGERERLPELVWTAVISQVCLGVMGGFLFVAGTPLLVDRLLRIPPGLRAQAHLIFLYMAVALPIDFANGSMSGVLGASQRFDLLNLVSIPSSALTYLVPVAAVWLGYGLPAIVLFLVLARATAIFVIVYCCFRLYPDLRSGVRFSPGLARRLLGFGGWVTVSGMVSPVLVYFDRFLIGSLISVAAVGFYTPPYMISTKLWILPASLAATLFPAFSCSAGGESREWVRSALARSLKFLILLAGPAALLLVFFARPLLTFWVGARFAAEGTLVLQILAVGVLMNSLAVVPYSLLQGIGRPDLTAKFHLVELPIHVALAWFLVTRFGLAGAATAWAIRMGFDFFLLVVAACWLTRTSPRLLAGRELGSSLGILAALAAGFAFVWISTHALAVHAVLTASLGCGFLICAWRYALDADEKCQIKLWLKASP